MRVSTDEQAKEGFSINAQQEKLTKYAMAKDWEIYDYYVDDVSGKNIQDRPDMLRMLKDLEDGKINNVLVYKIDRLTRSTKNLIELTELFSYHHCEFSSLMESIDTSTATGRMFLKIVGIFAEFERENLAERITFGYEQKTREGNYTNTNGVYGYDYIIGGGLVINEEESKIVKYIYDEYLNGLSMVSISKKLIEQKTPTKRGGKWCQSTVHSILTNPLYIGKVRYGVNRKHGTSFEQEANYDRIIEEDTFYAVQEIMKKRKKYDTKRYSSDNTYYLGALRCSVCGAKMCAHQSVQPRKKGTSKIYVRYYCYDSKSGNCNSMSFSHTKLETAFLDFISVMDNFIPDPDCLADTKNNNDRIGEIQNEIRKLELKLENFKNQFLNDRLTLEEYREFTNGIKEKFIALRGELEKLQGEKTSKEEIDYKQIEGIIGNIKRNWFALTNEEKRQFVHRFITNITAYSDNGEINITDLQFTNSKPKEKNANNQPTLTKRLF